MRIDTTYFATLGSPIGALLLTASERGLTGLYPTGHRRPPQIAPHWIEAPSRFATARQQLAEYFDGHRFAFDLALDARGTSFQQAVWTLLREIPYGETRSYGDLARRLERPSASRAVGAANGRNPLSIVVPCHRVIGTAGHLTGYAAGIELKRQLLDLERGAAPVDRASNRTASLGSG
ncbi:MAG: methylated-DNA--[protein]-cysteine S-methyltransferase [Planctomycetota bacterium]